MTGLPLDGALDLADAAFLLPPGLQAAFERHRAHLVQLGVSLRAAGIAEAAVEASVNTLMAAYRTELITVLKSWMKADRDEV